MMYQALYRKWRPRSFSDVVGQSAVCDTLARQVETGHISHAYLFSGSRGTGKTTCAKILAKAINCENPFHGSPCNKCPSCLGISSGEILDIVEIDAASNNGVDYVRDLREEAIYSPVSVKKRVYIIDEVHMFSQSAFNALLKIMEEPPEHVVFILATTELHKVPATISSRCQRFIFKRIPTSVISERLKFIAKNEGVQLSDTAAEYIATLSDGAMRDALSLFDQCISVGKGSVSEETVADVVGLAGKKQTFDMTLAIAEHDVSKTLSILNDIYIGGKNIDSVLSELAGIFRDVLILKTSAEELPQISARYTKDELSALANAFDTYRLCEIIEALQKTTVSITVSSNKRIDAELCCIKLCRSSDADFPGSLTGKVSEISEKMSDEPSALLSPRKNEVTSPEKSKPAPKQEIPTSQKPAEEKPAADAATLWKKIISEAKPRLSPGVLPLFSGVRVELSGNVLTISSESTFIMQMLKKSENMDIFRSAAAVVSPGINVIAGNIRVEAPESGIDELIDSLGDFEGITIK